MYMLCMHIVHGIVQVYRTSSRPTQSRRTRREGLARDMPSTRLDSTRLDSTRLDLDMPLGLRDGSMDPWA